MAPGRKRDPLWEYFEEIPSLGKGKRIKCKKEMQGLIGRVKHYNKNCLSGDNDADEDMDMSQK